MTGEALQRRYDLIAFDVDGTLVGHAAGKVIWNLLNQRFCDDLDADQARFRAYMAGEITYPQWVDLDIGGWAAASATRAQIAEVIRRELYLIPGAAETLCALRDRAYCLAVISGTLDVILHELLPQHPFEVVFTNRIEFDAQGLIAGWKATPYDMEGKAHALRDLARERSIPLDRTVYVGDNINDLQAMAAAGLAVAYEPKHQSVREAADVVIEGDMRSLLPLLE